jgi:hypothetical protein
MKRKKLKRVPAEQFTDRRLDEKLTAEQAERLFSACILAVGARRCVPPDPTVPSQHTEAVQRVYIAGMERGRREALAALADDGK